MEHFSFALFWPLCHWLVVTTWCSTVLSPLRSSTTPTCTQSLWSVVPQPDRDSGKKQDALWDASYRCGFEEWTKVTDQSETHQVLFTFRVSLLWMMCRFIHKVKCMLCLSLRLLIYRCCSVVDHMSVFHYFILSFLSFFLFPLSILFHDWQRAFLVNKAIFHLISTSSSSSSSYSSSTSLRVLTPPIPLKTLHHSFPPLFCCCCLIS